MSAQEQPKKDELSSIIEQLTRVDVGKAFSQVPAPIDEVLPGLAARTVGSIIGTGGVGKSLLALEGCVLVAGGIDISGIAAGRKFQTGKVVYLSLEDPVDHLITRIHNIGKHIPSEFRLLVERNFQPIAVPKKLLDELKLVTEKGRVNRKAIRFLSRLVEGVRLLVIDTARRAHSADENNSADMSAFIEALEAVAEATGCTILFVHHASKAATFNGSDDAHASRGSTVLIDNGRWSLNVMRPTDNDIKAFFNEKKSDNKLQASVTDIVRRTFVVATNTKASQFAQDEKVWMRRAEGGVLVPADIGHEIDQTIIAKRENKSSRKGLKSV